MASGTPRSNLNVASSPAVSDQSEKPTRSVKTRVTSRVAGRRVTPWVNACHTCSAAKLTSRVALSRSPSSRSAARAAASGAPNPVLDKRSPKCGSPGNARRAHLMNAISHGFSAVLTFAMAPNSRQHLLQ